MNHGIVIAEQTSRGRWVATCECGAVGEGPTDTAALNAVAKADGTAYPLRRLAHERYER